MRYKDFLYLLEDFLMKTQIFFSYIITLLPSPGAPKLALGTAGCLHSDPEFMMISAVEFFIRRASSIWRFKRTSKMSEPLHSKIQYFGAIMKHPIMNDLCCL